MSLINDMLKDLEARKASSGHPSVEDMLRRQGEALPGHIEELRHIDVTPPIEQAVRRRLPWLFWPFMLAMLAIAAALFLLIRAPDPDRLPAWMVEGGENRASSGDQALPPVLSSVEGLAGAGGEASPSVQKAGQVPSPAPVPETSRGSYPEGLVPRGASGMDAGRDFDAGPASPATPRPAPEEEARLVMLSAVDQGQALRLDLAFDAALREAVRLSRDGERVELYLPGIRSATAERPHPGLRDWHSQQAGEGWRLGFAWPSPADVRLQSFRSDDGLQHWELILAAATAMPAPAKTNGPSAATGADTPRPPSHLEGRSRGPYPAGASAMDGGRVREEGPRVREEGTTTQGSERREQRAHATQSPTPSLTPSQQAEALYAEAWLLQQKGRAELAMDKLRQAVQAQPEHVRARELLVRLLARAGQPRAAEVELVRGLEIQPRQPELVELMARMLADQGRGQEALGLLRERMQVDRLAHQALFAALAARAGDHAGAAEAYRHAAELDPRDPRWPLGRAIALENSGQPAASRAAYVQALGLEGLDAASRVFAQERLQHLGQGE
ncbi:MAG: tetratricopeptide repeat protein [Pseudomonadota bacterium]